MEPSINSWDALGIALWLILSIASAAFANNRKIGFLPVLIISLIFSPVVGFIAALFSKKKQPPFQNASEFEDSKYTVRFDEDS